MRHGLTLGELFRLEARRRGWNGQPRHFTVWYMEGWTPVHDLGGDAASPGSHRRPTCRRPATALVYPGGCLLEATELSEGRGTTRPFQLIGAPFVDPKRLADDLNGRRLPGVTFVPTYFRPQFQKHRGAVCGGVELLVTDPAAFQSYRAGVELLDALHRLWPAEFAWREAPYEFVSDLPAIDLLTGGPECRQAIERGERLEDWIASWRNDERAFRAERRDSCSIRRTGLKSPHLLRVAGPPARFAPLSRPPAPWGCGSAGWSWRRRPTPSRRSRRPWKARRASESSAPWPWGRGGRSPSSRCAVAPC